MYRNVGLFQGEPPLCPGPVQFWHETVRAYGAPVYGGSEFSEVLATAARITAGDSAVPRETERPCASGRSMPMLLIDNTIFNT